MHWITALAYTYCLATGLAFYTPHLFWLAVMLGGGPTSRFWHPILGIGFFALHHLDASGLATRYGNHGNRQALL